MEKLRQNDRSPRKQPSPGKKTTGAGAKRTLEGKKTQPQAAGRHALRPGGGSRSVRAQKSPGHRPVEGERRPGPVGREGLLTDVHLVEHVAAAAELVEHEKDVADVDVDAALQSGVELQIARQALDVAVESQADELTVGVHDG